MANKVNDMTYNELLSMADIVKARIENTNSWKVKRDLGKYLSKITEKINFYKKIYLGRK